MNLSEQTTDGVVIIVLNGRIDTDGAVALDEALHARLDADQYRIVLDMAGTTVLDDGVVERAFVSALDSVEIAMSNMKGFQAVALQLLD